MLVCSVCFWFYYVKRNVTFEKWQRKSNPKFPSPEVSTIITSSREEKERDGGCDRHIYMHNGG